MSRQVHAINEIYIAVARSTSVNTILDNRSRGFCICLYMFVGIYARDSQFETLQRRHGARARALCFMYTMCILKKNQRPIVFALCLFVCVCVCVCVCAQNI